MRGEPSDLSNLVVDACHDLRTPLAAAFGFARTIERMGGVTGDNAMYLRQVIEATEELEQLIAALSAVAHGERGTLRLRPSRSISASSRWRPPRAAAIRWSATSAPAWSRPTRRAR